MFRQQMKKFKGKKKRQIKIDTYCKAITAVVIAHGLILVTMSYVLAWFSRETVADVSVSMITEIVAPLCVYICTNCIANIFEKNKLSFSTPISSIKGIEVENIRNEEGEANGL